MAAAGRELADKSANDSFAALLSSARQRLRALGPWLFYAAAACACAYYLNEKADLVPKRGEWYSAWPPAVALQERAFLSGRLAVVPHPGETGNDFFWGRGGLHQAWGLGVPLLALPFHLVARLSGAPAFPDNARFLILYAITMVVLARALHRASRDESGGLVSGTAAAGFVMLFPTFVGLVSSRFLSYEQTIATAALWNVGLLAGLVSLVVACTPVRLALLCAAAGFSLSLRPPTAAFGFMTLALALWVAWQRRVGWRALVAAAVAFGVVLSIFFVGNILRFGSPLASGYETCLSGPFVNRMTRWGLPFAKVPFVVAAKEMFATMFLLDPISSQIMNAPPPATVAPYAVGERYREYYAPTYNRLILALWVAALLLVVVRLVRGRLWRRDRPLEGELATIIGAWAVPPTLVLFVFYARVDNFVTRYASDLYPGFAAAALCVGMALVGAVRVRAPRWASSAQLAMACAVSLYITSWHGWTTHMSTPVDRETMLASVLDIERIGKSAPSSLPTHFECGAPRDPAPVHGQLSEWRSDCGFTSGMVFGMKDTPCVSFTFRPAGILWTSADEQSLAGFRATADADRLRACGKVSSSGADRSVTMCDPHPPRYVLDGMRIYAIATLDENLNPVDRLRLMRIESAPACP